MNVYHGADYIEAGIYDTGSFIINSKLHCSDPCYDLHNGQSFYARKGVYNVRTGLFKAEHDIIDLLYDVQLIEFQRHIRKLMIDHRTAVVVNMFGNHISIYESQSTENFIDYIISLKSFNEYHDVVNDIVKYIPIVVAIESELNYTKLAQDKWILNFIKDSFIYYESNVAGSTEIEYNKLYSNKIDDRISNAVNKILDRLNSVALCRPLFLHIKHESINAYSDFNSCKWENIGHCLVDSGHLSFMDDEFYLSITDNYFDRIIGTTFYKKVVTGQFGTTTRTAYGDGVYSIQAIKDEYGNIVEAVYHFMLNEE